MIDRIMLVMLCSTAIAQSQSPQFHHLHGDVVRDITFVDSDRGFTAEDGGKTRFTTDGGETWGYGAIQNVLTSTDLQVRMRRVRFLDSDLDRGWMVGEGGVILKSVVGLDGREWSDANPFSRITDLRDAPLLCGQNRAVQHDIFMISDTEGWIVGEDGTVAKTTNGWLSWTSLVDQVVGVAQPCDEDPRDFYRVHFFEDSSPDAPFDHGIITSEFGLVYTTSDGGTTWAEVDVRADAGLVCPLPGANLEFWDLAFENPSISTSPGWLVGGAGTTNGYTFRTSGGGVTSTWSQSQCHEFLDPVAVQSVVSRHS